MDAIKADYTDDLFWYSLDIGVYSWTTDNSQFVRQCLELDSALTTYVQWDQVCETLRWGTAVSSTVTLWECAATAGCPDATSTLGSLNSDWQLLRSIGEIVTEFTSVDAFEYEEYMHILQGDIIFDGDDLFECVGYSDACSAILPSEDTARNVWNPLDGEVAEVEFDAGVEIDAMPWWVYIDSPDFYTLRDGDSFQSDMQIWSCDLTHL
jgi:hypothetical protein